MTTHWFRYKATACGIKRCEENYSVGHRWTGDWNAVNCSVCRAAFSKPMKSFYTLTNSHTESTNSKSRRYDTIGDAVAEAQARLSRKEAEGVIILKAVELVTLAAPILPPIKREPITD